MLTTYPFPPFNTNPFPLIISSRSSFPYELPQLSSEEPWLCETQIKRDHSDARPIAEPEPYRNPSSPGFVPVLHPQQYHPLGYPDPTRPFSLLRCFQLVAAVSAPNEPPWPRAAATELQCWISWWVAPPQSNSPSLLIYQSTLAHHPSIPLFCRISAAAAAARNCKQRTSQSHQRKSSLFYLLTLCFVFYLYRTSSNTTFTDGWRSSSNQHWCPRCRLPSSDAANARRPARCRWPSGLHWWRRRLRSPAWPGPPNCDVRSTCRRGGREQQEQGSIDCWH